MNQREKIELYKVVLRLNRINNTFHVDLVAHHVTRVEINGISLDAPEI